MHWDNSATTRGLCCKHEEKKRRNDELSPISCKYSFQAPGKRFCNDIASVCHKTSNKVRCVTMSVVRSSHAGRNSSSVLFTHYLQYLWPYLYLIFKSQL